MVLIGVSSAAFLRPEASPSQLSENDAHPVRAAVTAVTRAGDNCPTSKAGRMSRTSKCTSGPLAGAQHAQSPYWMPVVWQRCEHYALRRSGVAGHYGSLSKRSQMSAGENATPRLTAEVAAPAGALSETKPPTAAIANG